MWHCDVPTPDLIWQEKGNMVNGGRDTRESKRLRLQIQVSSELQSNSLYFRSVSLNSYAVEFSSVKPVDIRHKVKSILWLLVDVVRGDDEAEARTHETKFKTLINYIIHTWMC